MENLKYCIYCQDPHFYSNNKLEEGFCTLECQLLHQTLVLKVNKMIDNIRRFGHNLGHIL